MSGSFHYQGIGNSGEREGADRRRVLISRVSFLGRMEQIQRTVTIVECYHSGIVFAVNAPGFTVFCLPKMKGCKK